MAPRRRVLTPIQDELVRAQAKAWLAEKVIEPIPPPPWWNNTVLASKKDGRTRVCIDCTPANLVTRDFDWPLPRLQDLRFFVQEGRHFSRIDLKDAFFRIQVPRRYRHLTAFLAGAQHYQFRRMPFGLKTAPATFQRFMDHGLAALQGRAYWYMDDILIKGKTEQELRHHETLVRRQLRVMGCAINETKSTSRQRTLLFAGLTVTEKGLGANPELVRTLENLEPPSNKPEAQSALGLVSYLRDFIPLIGHFTAMLYPDKNGLRLPAPEYQKEWRRLMRHIQEAMVSINHWKPGVHATLFTDASQYALGAIILQDGRIVAACGRKLSASESRYSATDREHLGLVEAASKLKIFLHQNQSRVDTYTDHSALITRKWLDLTPRQARWALKVATWIPNLTHVRGKDNPADFLSRIKSGKKGADRV